MIAVWSGTVLTLNRPQTSRTLDQQQGHRQHPTEVPAPSHAMDAVQRHGGVSPREDSSCVRCPSTKNFHFIESNLPVSPGKRRELQTSTRGDATLQYEKPTISQ